MPPLGSSYGSVMDSLNGNLRLRFGYLLKKRHEHRLIVVPPIVAERKLIQVRLQELLTHHVVCAADPALYQAPESLNRVRMDIAHHVDSRTVIDALVLI